jgi:methyl-accepting chemotaxis protein
MPQIAGAVFEVIDTLRSSQSKALADMQTEIATQVNSTRTIELVLSAGAVLTGLLLAWLIGGVIARPVLKMTDAMRRLASGDTNVQVPGIGSLDEVGEMATAVQVFKDNMLETERLRLEQGAAQQRARQEQKQALLDLANDFEARVGNVVKDVSAASCDMQATAQALESTARETTRQAATVASASEQATMNVQTVASATEELSASISEISQQVAKASGMISDGVRQAELSNEQVHGLTAAAERIGDVVRIISGIAGQTNLLALNATIEAARGRCRQRLRGRRQRGQGPRHPNRSGDRGNRHANQSHTGCDPQFGATDTWNHRNNRPG